ncbi:MAG: hypothetical protein JWR58_1860 [Pseudonocardia sp.]|nr:hypothetical protein [Pseudonocardia sp.]
MLHRITLPTRRTTCGNVAGREGVSAAASRRTGSVLRPGDRGLYGRLTVFQITKEGGTALRELEPAARTSGTRRGRAAAPAMHRGRTPARNRRSTGAAPPSPRASPTAPSPPSGQSRRAPRRAWARATSLRPARCGDSAEVAGPHRIRAREAAWAPRYVVSGLPLPPRPRASGRSRACGRRARGSGRCARRPGPVSRVRRRRRRWGGYSGRRGPRSGRCLTWSRCPRRWRRTPSGSCM